MRNSLHWSPMTHLIILLDTIKKDRHKFKEWGSKKNDMNLYFESSRISTTELFVKIVNGTNEMNEINFLVFK